MNKERKKALQGIADKLLDIIDDFNIIKEEEEDAYYNMPESLQSSERGEMMQEGIDILDTIYCDLESCSGLYWT